MLFKGAGVFERSRTVDVVMFGKTGTLTTGVTSLTDIATDEDEAGFLRRVGSVEAGSEHPIGQAGALGAEERDVELGVVTDLESFAGQGVVGTIDGVEVTVGKAKLAADRGLLVPDRHAEAGPAHLSHDPGEPLLGVLLQHRRHPAGRPRVPQPDDRSRRDGVLLGLGRVEQPAIAAGSGVRSRAGSARSPRRDGSPDPRRPPPRR